MRGETVLKRQVEPINSLFGNFTSAGRESEHEPRLIGYPMRVKRGHLIEQLLVRFRGFLQLIVVL